ncbi:hypothetical protein ABH916_000729 [Peribacillus frigoritolerans]|uniref:hypothetical protein n=1 Tax=Peribacillus frigoritolerans TaxID=450367 RepID=UPI003835B6A2
MNFKSMANLEQEKMMARGNPQKMAECVAKRAELASVIDGHFNEEFPFVKSFNADHLESLKTLAEENSDDESAQIRYKLQKERYAVSGASKTAHIDKRLTKTNLTQKLQDGNVSPVDLKAAEKLARQNSTPENLVLYSTIKKQLENGGEEQ